MKRIFYLILVLSIAIFACRFPPTVTPTQPPVVVTEPPIATTNATCNELSLYLDPALASSFTCETVPESPEGIEVYPQYTNLTLQGYVLADKFFEPHISVFSVPQYTGLLPDFIPGRVAALQGLIGGALPTDSALPLLPVFNAAETFHAQYQALPFASGGGIRYLTLYAQYYAPVNNHDLFYSYQGLTNDGQHWVSAILPITNPILPVNGDNPPGGMSWEDFGNNYDSYTADMVAQLNAQAAGNYAPTLTMLDTLVASITTQP